VHASLLLIFLGGIIDALYGWRGFIMLTPGNQGSQVEMRAGAPRHLPFALRCDATGEETYADGTPKRWWSRLAVIDRGREVVRKEIAVNDPLVYGGLRFYQATYGSTGKVDQLILNAMPMTGAAREPREIFLTVGQPVKLDADATVELAEFFPDYVVEDGRVYARSNDVVNPAVHLVVTSRQRNRSVNVWLPEIPGIAENSLSPYLFEAKDLKMGRYTGLQVSHEPGQWLVWAGVILLGAGLTFVFYVVHTRFWVVPAVDRLGRSVLWVGGTSNRNREAFEAKFQRLVEEIEEQLHPKAVGAIAAQATTIAGN
jgi:cytochrome c biogenesis protein